MRFMKKVAVIVAVCFTALSCMPNLMAAEKVVSETNNTQYGFKVTSALYTSGPSYAIPEINISQENRSSGTYLCISVNQPNVTVYVNGSTSGVTQKDNYRYEYKVTKTDTYSVRARGYGGESSSRSMYISVAGQDTSLTLSKDYRYNGEVYLVIKASDTDGISKVTVDDSSISFNEYSGETNYRIYRTGTYTVKVVDKYGNVKTDSIYINVDKDVISIDLSKTKHGDKWYLVIKAYADARINRVTVDNQTITFPSSGGTEEYEVKETGTYKVTVRDSNGYVRTDSLYIDTGATTTSSNKPEVTVTQNYKVNNNPGWYLLIEATDDGSIASVTVNGQSIPYDASKKRAEYYVPVDATYTIVVTDNDGNSVTKSTYAAGNAGINVNNTSQTNSNSQSAKVVFKLNSKSWSKDGVTQEQMNVAPKMVKSRVYLPIRYIAYALGVEPSQITWNASDKMVTINSGYETIQVKIGSKNMYVNNKLVEMDVAPIQSGGRVMLPISQIKNAFSNQNIQLDWDNGTKQLTVTR